MDTLQSLYNNSPATNAPQVVSSTATVININFDGTKNNGQFPAEGESPTNISQLSKLQADVNGKANTIYLPGVGAQTVPTGTLDANGNPAAGSNPSNWDSIPFNAGDVANSIVKDAYTQLTERVGAILAENPSAEISLNLSGFSRGGAEAVAFANYVNEHGIPGLYEAGQVPIDSMVLFDPVSQTNGQLNTAWPSNVKNSLVMVAENEGSLTVTAVANPLHGTASLITQPDGSQRVLFTPEANYHGIASFEYTVTDPDGLMSTATATIAIAAVNDTPVTANESAQTDEDVGLVFTQAQLLANDTDVDIATDGDSLHVSRVGLAMHGTAFIDTQGQIRFVPDANYHGAAQFTYWVADSFGAEAPAVVNVVVAPVNDVPVAISEETVTQEDTTLFIDPASLLANDTDPDTVTDGQILSVSAVSNATHGSVTLLANGTIQFVPDTNFHGAASFDYTVSDGNGGTSVTTAVIRINAVNDAPVALGESATGDEDNELTSVANPHNGSVSFQNGSVVFTPNANFSGNADFQYQVSDGAGGSTWATAYVTVNPVNDAPVITSTSNSLDTYTVYAGGGESGTATASGSRRIGDVNAFDVEGDTVHFGIYAQPDHGYLTIDANTGHWIYSTTATTQAGTSFTNITANTDTYNGGVDFSFYAEDSHGARTISQTIHAEYHGTSSAGVAQTIAPIVIDLGNDGLDLVNPSQSPFEYRSENALEPARYGWVGVNDGLLAFDQNHDGTINNLNEISFTGYLEGAKTDLEGLAAFDSNHDGVVNASDAKWSDFGVFQDKNQNGVCDAGEFISLAAANITQIDLQRTGESKVVAGNIVFGDATVHRTDGTTTTAGDVAFLRDGVQAPTHEVVQSFLQGQSPLTLAPAITEPSEVAPDVHPVISAATDNLDAVNAAELAEYARIRQMANYFNQVVATAIVDPSVESPALGYVDLTSLHHADMISSLIDVKNAQSSFEAHS